MLILKALAEKYKFASKKFNKFLRSKLAYSDLYCRIQFERRINKWIHQ